MSRIDRLTPEERDRIERWRAMPSEVRAAADQAESRARRESLQLWAAAQLAPSLAVCEALLAGVAVPARRLDAAWVRELGLAGDVELDEALALRVSAWGPLRAVARSPRSARVRPLQRVLRLGQAGRLGERR